jgi:hypothetical protein
LIQVPPQDRVLTDSGGDEDGEALLRLLELCGWTITVYRSWHGRYVLHGSWSDRDLSMPGASIGEAAPDFFRAASAIQLARRAA